jgi:hypothetical protein
MVQANSSSEGWRGRLFQVNVAARSIAQPQSKSGIGFSIARLRATLPRRIALAPPIGWDHHQRVLFAECINVVDPVLTDLLHLADGIGEGDVDNFGS